ncbi:MAG TPA: acyclic terpene utilization AtuA family protein [Candidatus Dormibacteraeota bacterium]|jgi:hypothetical protein|nr:acyclic terpene utilization AtuA family protein [Candidatus Dormibacteraeota bacterium]
MATLRLGAGGAYWGDAVEPAVELVRHADISYLGVDFLAELTMALLARQRLRDPAKGWIEDVVPYLDRIWPPAAERGIRVVTNAGGANPAAAAAAVCDHAAARGWPPLRLGVVEGDDVTDRIEGWRRDGLRLVNLDTGEPDIDRIADRVVSATVYLGSEGIVEALGEGAQVVLTGRCSDNALFVGPMMHEFGWSFADPDWDRLGAAVIVGHLLECGACATGGMSSQFATVERPWEIGFPIAEVTDAGEAVITKLPGSGGVVNPWTIKEQIVYEIHDPARYLMPDAVADFTAVELEEEGRDRVRVRGMRGCARPDTLKALIGYRDGWIAEGLVVVPWPDARGRAAFAQRLFEERLGIAGVDPLELRVDRMGVNSLHGEAARAGADDPAEICLRFAVHVATRAEAEAARREITHVWGLGAVGTAFGSPMRPREVIALWPALVPRDAVAPHVRVSLMEAGR